MNVATIKLSVLASFLVPILVTSIAITILTAVICIILAKSGMERTGLKWQWALTDSVQEVWLPVFS